MAIGPDGQAVVPTTGPNAATNAQLAMLRLAFAQRQAQTRQRAERQRGIYAEYLGDRRDRGTRNSQALTPTTTPWGQFTPPGGLNPHTDMNEGTFAGGVHADHIGQLWDGRPRTVEELQRQWDMDQRRLALIRILRAHGEPLPYLGMA